MPAEIIAAELHEFEVFDSYGKVWARYSSPTTAANVAAVLNAQEREEPVMVRPAQVPLRHRRSKFYPWSF